MRAKGRMSRFFIDRPIFAWVIALALVLAGILAIRALSIAQFPRRSRRLRYPVTAIIKGADARTRWRIPPPKSSSSR